MAAQIYFFDDQLHNDPTQYPEYNDLNITFIHIQEGNYHADGNFLFQNNFYLNDDDAIDGHVATLAELPNPNGSGLTPYPFFRNSAFHIEPEDFEEYAHGDTLTLIFDWDQTMTLTNGMILGDGDTLEEQLNDLIAAGDVPATWTTETLARWYLHNPDDENRIMNLKDFFEEVQQMNIPVFILTANGLSESKPNLMPDILKAALNLEISGLFRAGHGGGITKREAIRDIIIPAANDHWDAVANQIEEEEAAANAEANAEAANAEGPAKKKQKVKAAAAEGQGGGRRRTRRRKRKKRKRRRRRTRRRRCPRHPDEFDKELKRVIAQHRRHQIARGDKRFKATKGLVKWSRPNKTKRKNRVYYRKRKTRKS